MTVDLAEYRAEMNASYAGQPWPDIIPIMRGSTTPFPVDALPVDMAAAVHEVAEAVKVDPAIPAQAALGVLAGLIGPSTTVTILETWTPRANLWLTSVAGSTDAKSPGMSPFLPPLAAREAELKEEAEADRRRAEVMLPVLQAQLKALQKDPTVPLDAMLTLQSELEDAEAALNRVPRVYVDDVTPERMVQIMADNGGALTVVNDEGSLFMHLTGMYSKKPNMGAALKSWEGSMIKVDRKGGNGAPGTELTIQRPLMTLIAAIQPHVVAGLGASTHGLEARGLLGRVLWAWPQSVAGHRMLAGHDPAPYVALPVWNDRVHALSHAGEKTVVLNPEARDMFIQFHDHVEVGLREGGVYTDIATFAPKIRECAARIAGLFARVDGAVIVSTKHMSRAIALVEFYLDHTQALVESWSAGPVDAAIKLLGKLRTGGVVIEDAVQDFKAFRVRQANRAVRVPLDTVIDALDVLEAHGYVRPLDPAERFGDASRRPGKTSPLVQINPALWGSTA